MWGLFTGWASVGAYAYGRPHVGYQALMANALLTWQGALGYVTELLSGEFNAPFGRSSHHQVWSEAMVVTPVRARAVRARGAGRREDAGLPPAAAGRRGIAARCGMWPPARRATTSRSSAREGRTEIRLEPRAAAGERSFVLSPAFPLDARVERVTVDGSEVRFRVTREGDVQRAEVEVRGAGPQVVVFAHTAGTEVEPLVEAPQPGAPSRGLRVLRARATDALHLRLEGLAGRTYRLRLRTPAGPVELPVSFEGPPGTYVRRDLRVPLTR